MSLPYEPNDRHLRSIDSYHASPDTDAWLEWHQEQTSLGLHGGPDAAGAEVREPSPAIMARVPAPVASVATPVAPADTNAPASIGDKLDLLFAPSVDLDARDELVGIIGSAELLARDEANDLCPTSLPTCGNEGSSMLWVDELSCIGCKYCSSIARQTFQMAEGDGDYGTARVVQQAADLPEVLDEAIDSCPADCIHQCTRTELETLEEYRGAGYLDDIMARSHTQRLTGNDGGGGNLQPHWRDPLENTGWRRGAKFLKTETLKMANPLLSEADGLG
jgi:ferredoxin